MKNKKLLITTIASLCLLCVSAPHLASVKANAQTSDITSANSLLSLPVSYDQYLNLESPSSVAFADEYFAVADSNKIYIYSRASGTYKTYVHEYNNDSRLNLISQINFADGNKLYFTDTSNYLFKIDCGTLGVSRTAISCSVFNIFDGTVYFSTISLGKVTIAATSLLSPSPESAVTYDSYPGNAPPALYNDNGNLFYVDKFYLTDYSKQSVIKLPLDNDSVTSMVSVNGTMYLCDTEGTLTVYDYNTATVIKTIEGNYSYASAHNGFVYLVNGNCVEQLNMTDNSLTNYRICSSSDAVDRLSSASDAVLFDDKLFIADATNKRISVYDEIKEEYYCFSTDYTPVSLSADSSTLAVNSGGALTVYTVDGEKLYTFDNLSGGESFQSVTNVYGVYYAVTSNNSFCKIYKDEETGEYAGEKISKRLTAVGKEIASDLYGNIYVYCADNSVIKFSEENVMQSSSSGSFYFSFPQSVSGFSSDYAGNVYGLNGNTLYSSNGDTATFSSEGCVYQPMANPVKIVFNFESNKAYSLYKNYVTVTYALPIPGLNNIPTQDVDKEIFKKECADLEVLKINKNAVLVAFDLNELYGAGAFPFTGYTRLKEERQAIKLGETDDYYIVSLFNDDTKKYTANIVIKDYCEIIDPSTCLSQPDGFDNGKGYTTNAVSLYKYPYLAEQLTIITLQRSDGVNILGEITLNGGVDYDYSYVSVIKDGEVFTGYVPSRYLIPVENTSGSSQVISYGYLSTDEKSLTLTANDGATKTVSTSERFSVYGDPYKSDTVTISYTDEDGKEYFTTVSSELLKSTNTKQLRTFAVILIAILAIILITDYFILRKKDDDYEDEIY